MPCLACWLGLPIACRSCGCALVRSALPLLMLAALAVLGGVVWVWGVVVGVVFALCEVWCGVLWVLRVCRVGGVVWCGVCVCVCVRTRLARAGL